MKKIEVTKGQLSRLIENVHQEKYKTLREGQFNQGKTSGNAGTGAAEGMAVVLAALTKAYKYITNPQVKQEVGQVIKNNQKKSVAKEVEVEEGKFIRSKAPGVGVSSRGKK